jgi:hypothetical protein
MKRPAAGGNAASSHECWISERRSADHSLFEPEPSNQIVVGAAAERGAAGRGEYRVWPGHTIKHDQAQTIGTSSSHRIGAEQAGIFLRTKNINQRRGVERIDMLGPELDVGRFKRRRDTAMDGAQPLDRGEQAERAAPRSQEQLAIGGGNLIELGASRRSPRTRESVADSEQRRHLGAHGGRIECARALAAPPSHVGIRIASTVA